MEENKGNGFIEVLAWLAVISIIAFCIRFNYKLTHNEGTVQDYNTSITNNISVS